MHENVVSLSEAEEKLSDLVENIRSSTQKIDEMCHQ
jgi:PHD/YefM family antitoxin component YafN of YafNO toxin-antitoxin module